MPALFHRSALSLAALGLLAASPAAAQPAADPAPAVFKDVIDCRAIQDSTQRLACYDRAVGAMADASEKKELFVADKERVRETKRGLFGLSLPSVRIFGEGEDVDEIESKVAGLSTNARGKWVFTLDDGVRWMQTDLRNLAPRVGDKIVIKRAAFGSFMAKVGGATAIRVERLAN